MSFIYISRDALLSMYIFKNYKLNKRHYQKAHLKYRNDQFRFESVNSSLIIKIIELSSAIWCLQTINTGEILALIVIH